MFIFSFVHYFVNLIIFYLSFVIVYFCKMSKKYDISPIYSRYDTDLKFYFGEHLKDIVGNKYMELVYEK